MSRAGVDLPRSAQAIALELTAGGVLIPGESPHGMPGGPGTIACLSFEVSQEAALDRGTGMPTGRRSYGPLSIRKRIDKATPLIARALVRGEEIEAVFRFFRDTGPGKLEQFFTVEISNAAVASTSQFSPDGLSHHGAPPAAAALEDVLFVFQRIVWRHEAGPIEFEDHLS